MMKLKHLVLFKDQLFFRFLKKKKLKLIFGQSKILYVVRQIKKLYQQEQRFDRRKIKCIRLYINEWVGDLVHNLDFDMLYTVRK